MAKPLVMFADPEAAARTYLLAAFADFSEVWLPSTISTSPQSTTLSGNTTHVQVELEVGSVEDYPVLERAQVRVTCYAGPGKRTNVKALASLAQGLLYGFTSETVANVTPLIGRSDVITDPTSGNLMCWFIVQLDLRATQLA